MILLIDNYDSFSYNLYQLIGKIDSDIKIIRNDELSVEEIIDLKPKAIVISPGPGKPEDAGISVGLIKAVKDIPILGICLGHQAICVAFGAKVSYAKKLMHGKQSYIYLDNKAPIFNKLCTKLKVARYHSLCAVEGTIPDCLEVIGSSEEAEIMAVRHREYPIYGLQFHPESILTQQGEDMIKNFLLQCS